MVGQPGPMALISPLPAIERGTGGPAAAGAGQQGRSGQMRGDGIPGPGDLGRRIAARRQRLGWSRADLATRAGLSEAYLTYIETHPALVTMTCLVGLAD